MLRAGTGPQLRVKKTETVHGLFPEAGSISVNQTKQIMFFFRRTERKLCSSWQDGMFPANVFSFGRCTGPGVYNMICPDTVREDRGTVLPGSIHGAADERNGQRRRYVCRT